ncbi:hypothetical protein EJ02DRAFT_256864 [Clathrospora elynae]|uniref:Uncharacterized protein n=1 Tax=Clathrospora elynae TaxID=706981 RepID=A0A6A5SFK8_9PLEO|nr:hypothetical protein EJ02DRAFT_256864 [Clathrospora elynae]
MSSHRAHPSAGRSQTADSNSDSDPYIGSEPPLRSRRGSRIPRHLYPSPASPIYTRIIRLEGQILSLLSILRFHLRYACFYLDKSLDLLRLTPLPMYFAAIEELVSRELRWSVKVARPTHANQRSGRTALACR